MPSLPPEDTHDRLFGGALSLRQARRGHRAGTDAVLLAATVPAAADGLLIDAGAASGAVGLMVLHRAAHLRATLLEIDPTEAARARENLHANAFEQRAAVVCVDLLDPVARRSVGLRDATADVVVSNPPFLDGAHSRASPDMDKARAHMLGTGGLAAWIAACLALLRADGAIHLIHRADAVAGIMAGLEGATGAVCLRPVYAIAGRPAIRLLVTARKGSRAPLQLLPALILQGDDGRFTAEAEALHLGRPLT